MNRARRASIRTAALGGLLLLSGAVPVLADWRADFMNGVAAMDRRRWSDAAQLFERAIAENGVESRNLVSSTIGQGMRNEPYLPYYHLGLARFRLNDFAGAVAAWDESVRQQKVQGFQGRFKDLETNLKVARANVGPAAPPPDQLAAARTRALAAIGRVEARRAALSEVTTDPHARGVLAKNTALSGQLAGFQGRLTPLASQVERATDAAGIEAIEGQAARIDQDLVAFRQRLTTLAGNRRSQWSQLETLATEIENKRTAARRRLESLKGVSPGLAGTLSSEYDGTLKADLKMPTGEPAVVADLDALRRRFDGSGAELDRLLGRLSQPPPGAALRTPTTVQAPTPRAVGLPTAAPIPDPTEAPPELPVPTGLPPESPPHPLLRSGVRRYFDSAYQDAIRILSTADFGAERFARLHGELFLAAAKFQLYRLGDASEPGLLEEARGHVASVVSTEPGFTPAAKYFSPAFLAFFDEGRRSGAAPRS